MFTTSMIIIDLFTLSCFTISKCYHRKNDQYEKKPGPTERWRCKMVSGKAPEDKWKNKFQNILGKLCITRRNNTTARTSAIIQNLKGCNSS